jgi:hypothetical protein
MRLRKRCQGDWYLVQLGVGLHSDDDMKVNPMLGGSVSLLKSRNGGVMKV